MCAQMDVTRLDKWLWAARFYRTRSLAQQAVERGHVLMDGQRCKLARAVHVGDLISVRQGDLERIVAVRGLSEVRGSAPIAQQLYEETPDSIRRRVEAIAKRALAAEPADAIRGGRPTKRDRRDLERWQPDPSSGPD